MVDVEWLRRNLFLLGGAIVGLFLIGFGIFLTIPHQQKSQITIEPAQNQTSQKALTVDVSGAVLHPGVYNLESESRVADALSFAGGITGEADGQWVEKNINRAAKIVDGTKIYIPFVGDKVLTSSNGGIVAGISTNSKSTSVNLATQAELETLTGVGPVTAAKIIENRPYQTLEELVTKKAIGQSLYDKLKGELSL